MSFNHRLRPLAPLLAAIALLPPAAVRAQPAAVPSPEQHDGAHDFDFLLGDWKAHVKRLPDRLVGSTAWIEYDGISRHHPVLGSSANFEEFEVDSPKAPPGALAHIRAQTLRLYDPVSRQWSIFGLDVDKGSLGLPATIGQFHEGVGEFTTTRTGRAAWSWSAFSGPTPAATMLTWSRPSLPMAAGPGR